MALVLLAGLSAGVVGHECPEGQVCIQSGDGSSDLPTVDKDGAEWNSTLTLNQVSPSDNVTDRLENKSFSGENGSYQVRFDGVMKVNSPCYKPVYTVDNEEESYSMNISAEKEENTTCTQVITRIGYSMEFESGSAFKIDVNQGNLSENFEHPDYSDEESQGDSDQGSSSEEDNTSQTPKEKQGLFGGFFDWLGSIL